MFSTVFYKESGWSENHYIQAGTDSRVSGCLHTSSLIDGHAGLRVSNWDSAFSKSVASFRLPKKIKPIV